MKHMDIQSGASGLKSIQVLMIEDSLDDSLLIQEVMIYHPTEEIQEPVVEFVVKTHLQEGVNFLSDPNQQAELVLLDLQLPDSSGIDSFHTLHKAFPRIPIIVLTGLNDETLAREAVSGGAQDYLFKDEINRSLLTRSIHYAIERSRILHEKESLIVELKEALENVKRLQGLLPICSNCKKIRNDDGYWAQVDQYLQEYSEVKFSHGLCPDCAREMFPEFYQPDPPYPGDPGTEKDQNRNR